MKTNSPRHYQPDTQAFRAWLGTVQTSQYKYTIQKIKELCKVNQHKINNWRSGKSGFSLLEKHFINDYAGYKVFNVEEEKP